MSEKATTGQLLFERKKTLRTRLLKLLRSQKKEDRLKKSRIIQKKLFSTKEFKKAKVILFYASFDGEVETFDMMKKAQKLGKTIVLPTIIRERKDLILSLVANLKKDLVKGPYGIQQPRKGLLSSVGVEDIDLAVVPGVGFDKNNNRLGRGAGYYDKFLSDIPSHVPAFGLAFDFQIVPAVPRKKGQDIPVSRVIVN